MAFDVDGIPRLPVERRAADGWMGGMLLAMSLGLALRWVLDCPPHRIPVSHSKAAVDLGPPSHDGEVIAPDFRMRSAQSSDANGYRSLVDLNRCDWPELCLLPGVSETLARRIIQVRNQRGPFRSLADLDAVPGIGSKTARQLLPRVAFSIAPGRAYPKDSTSLRSLEWDVK